MRLLKNAILPLGLTLLAATDGEVIDLTTRWVDETLEQTFIAEDGQRKNVFALSPDGGTLEMQVTVTSPRLAAPLTYTLRYRRQ